MRELSGLFYLKVCSFSNMTHEIRTPLNAIVGFSEVLSSMGDAIDDETRQMCGDSIRQNAQLLHKLINDVMELSEQEERTICHFNLELALKL